MFNFFVFKVDPDILSPINGFEHMLFILTHASFLAAMIYILFSTVFVNLSLRRPTIKDSDSAVESTVAQVTAQPLSNPKFKGAGQEESPAHAPLQIFLTGSQAVLKVIAATESGGSWAFAFPSLILTVCKG